ncbi:TonB-dependent receptor [Terriglobus albidus]|uniref:TonB-dependent receptor n=1 Tax=Terriglobus albidus TaxID=1592106 RepID=A0A5B9E8W4_9BACT|nr:TonB-dependent receptor [Terriglobus albidus]QEE28239.1 TonB-dependent receptor [Terriglobus albidus]
MKRFAALLLLLLASASIMSAQEFRATLTGRVADPTGATIPHASVLVTNMETGVNSMTASNGAGEYTVPFLAPGKYRVTVTAQGFQRYVHENLTLESGSKVGEDVTMQVGATTEEVRVTTDVPLIQTETASAGQTLSAQEIENLPDNGRSPLALAKTMYGVVVKQKNSVVQARPFDNSASSDFSLGGGNSQSNEYLLNGVPNMQDSSRLPGFSPLQDSVQEVKVDVFNADASTGDTSGGTVNLVTKSGANQFHGSLSEFNQFSAINAPNRWFAGTTKQPAYRQNQYGGHIAGPIWIPHVVNGKDKLFFLYAYEGFKGSQPNPTLTTVPTAAERNGDFSALLGLGTNKSATRCTGYSTTYNSYQIFDPASGTADPNCSGQALRTAFPNNIIPASRLSQIAQKYLSLYPQPNVTGTADGQNNFYSSNNTVYSYSSNSGRFDWSIGANNKLFVDVHRSEYQPIQNNYFNNIATGSKSYTVYQGGLVDFVHTFSSSVVMDSRISLTRSYKNSAIASGGVQPSSYGFPGYMDSSSTAGAALPRIQFSESGTAYTTLSAASPSRTAFDTLQFFTAVTWVHGRHTLKMGPDLRQNRNYATPTAPGTNNYFTGNFAFDNTFTKAGTALAGPVFGGSMASFLLGVPSSGAYTISPYLTFNNHYFAGFVQDDWKLTRRLTLNLGIRLESETSINESHNRAVSYFDPNAVNSAASAAATKYAASPVPELAASSFNAKGGLVFASDARRHEYATAPLYITPRVGLAFNPPIFNDRMVIRTGFGIFVNPFNDYYTPQSYGYISNTSLVASLNSNFTPAASLSNPFPTANPILQPTGNALGVNTYLGQAITIRPMAVKVPYSERWYLDLQFQVSKNTMFQVGYLGNHQVHLSYSNCLSCVPVLPLLSRSPARDAAVQNNLSGAVTNPFKGAPGMTGTLATASTIPKYVLLQAYPQFGNGTAQSGVTQQLAPGASSNYNALMARFQKRVSDGLTLNVNYTYSRNLQAQPINPGGALTYQTNPSDFPQHLSISGVYRLPFGRGRQFVANAPYGVNVLIGGWTMNTIFQHLSGSPIQWNNAPLFADGTAYNNVTFDARRVEGAFDTTKFNRDANSQPSSIYNYRTFPLFYGRQDGTNNLDVSVLKDFNVFKERIHMQYRFEAYNVLNHTNFGAPTVAPTSTSFGLITSTSTPPRVLQQALRLNF